MYCPKCGKSIEDSAAFCSSCGTQINETISNNQSSESTLESSAYNHQEPFTNGNKKSKSIITLIGIIVSFFGIAAVIIIALVGLIVYGRIYFFDGYTFTAILCNIAMVLMTIGIVLMTIGLIVSRKNKNNKKKRIIICAIALALSVALTTILLINAINNKKSSNYEYSSYSSNSSDMDHSTYCLLYMKVSNVNLSHRGSYTYCTGSISNTGTYSIKFVKVKGVFKSRSGQVIDTDWTYAVDSSWLDPGESNQFEMMIRDEYGEISTADVSVVID